jgi:hypothetical protein
MLFISLKAPFTFCKTLLRSIKEVALGGRHFKESVLIMLFKLCLPGKVVIIT